MAITIKSLDNDKCSSCNTSGQDDKLWEFSISRSNTIQGSTLFYRLCIDCVDKMCDLTNGISKGKCL